MKQTRLSPIYNNCALHSLVPEICNEIAKFADDSTYDNQHNADYLRLKTCFADYYNLDKEHFDWEDLQATLEGYNPFDKQVILGPVLRLFMVYPNRFKQQVLISENYH